jgi:hypothetical protein
MKTTYLSVSFLTFSFLGFQTIHAQSDTMVTEETIEEAVEVPIELYEEEESAPMEVAPWEEDDEPRRTKIRPKYLPYAKVSLGFLSLTPYQPAASGAYVPSTDFFNSDQFSFEFGTGKNLYEGKVRFWFGFGVETENSTFNDPMVRITNRADSFSHSIASGPKENAVQSSLHSQSICIPISLGIQNHKRRPTMKLQLGVYVGYRYRFYTEVEYDDGARVRTYDDLEMNPISIDPFISLQFKRIGVFARTSLLPIVSDNNTVNQTRGAFGIFLGT